MKIVLLLLSLSCFIAMILSQTCVDYTGATLVGVGQTTVPDTTCSANANPFPAGLTLAVGLIETENLQLFYIPAQAGEPSYELSADTCSSDFDTNMVIFAYNVVDSTFEFIASNDDFCNLQSSLIIGVSDEQQIYIAVAGYDASTFGELVLTISMNTSAVSTVDQIRFISEDIEDIAGKVADMSTAIDADTSLDTADTNIASIGSIEAAIATEYDAGGLVTDMTAYVTALSSSLSQLSTDASDLQDSIASRVTADSTDYDAAVSSINGAITTLSEQAGNISSDLTTSQSTSTTIDSTVTTLKSGLDTQITSFTSLNSYFSSTMGSIETNSFTTFACKYLALTSTTSVPAVLMSPNEYNGKLEDVATVMNTIITNLPSPNPACNSFMTSYSSNLAAAMYMTAFSNLQSSYQCYY